MRKQPLAISITMIIALVLTTAVAGKAADPIIGSWKLNVAISKISPILQSTWHWAASKGRMEVYREIEGDQIEFTEEKCQTDGTPISLTNTFPKQGGILKEQQPSLTEGISFVETVTDPGNWYVTALENGKQVELIHKTVSKDGRIMRQTIKGTDPKGKPYEGLLIYDKQ
jgi:hypothetical protein